MEQPQTGANGEKSKSVYSNYRQPIVKDALPVLINEQVSINDKNEMDGLCLLESIYPDVITACFFDPQYRGIMDRMKYGNVIDPCAGSYSVLDACRLIDRNFIGCDLKTIS